MRPAQQDPFSPLTTLTARQVDRGGDYVVVRLAGDLSADAPSLAVERALKNHYVDDGVRRIRLDLRDLHSIDLEGVAVLVAVYREAERRGKTLTVERARGSVRDKLVTTGLLRIIGAKGLRGVG